METTSIMAAVTVPWIRTKQLIDHGVFFFLNRIVIPEAFLLMEDEEKVDAVVVFIAAPGNEMNSEMVFRETM